MLRSTAWIAAFFALCASCGVAEASNVKRSAKARADFQRVNPCPATGRPRGACPGYVVDHVRPLCAGGADTPANMQWLTATEARRKDAEWLHLCRPKGPGYQRRKTPAQ